MQLGKARQTTDEKLEQLLAQRATIEEQLAQLRGEVKALRTERDRTAELTKLNAEIERMKLEKARLVEENDRKLRETTHKVGLLREQQQHEVANAKKETELKVREQNLAADQARFKGEMDFQREHLQREVTRTQEILDKVLDRLPDVNAALTGKVGTPRSTRRTES